MSSPSVPAESGRRVLVVEDRPDSRESLCTLLEMWGYDVEAVADGAEGVEKALAWQPNVAVVDIGLPLLDGYEVARRLRAALRENILLIALTAYNQPEDRRMAWEAGFDFHMPKPAQLDTLRHLLAR